MAVYTTLSTADIETHLAQYDLGRHLSHAGISEGVENTNYRIDTEQGAFILTLFEKRVDKQALPFYLAFMQALAKAGIPTAGVVLARDGQATKTLAGKTALITRFLPGAWPRHPTPAQTEQVGRTLAQMHLIGQQMKQTRANAMSLPAWISLIHACGPRADELQPGLFDFLDASLQSVADHTPHSLPQGVVHADLFPDNVFFDGDRLSGVIDFYFACRDTLTYDLMLTLNAWCFTPLGDVDPARARALIRGYLGERQLSAAEIAALPHFGQAAALRIVATRLYDFLHPAEGALVRAKDPLEHVRILRHHQAVAANGNTYDWWPAA